MNDRPSLADEVWIATALLHREHPDRTDFAIQVRAVLADSRPVTLRDRRTRAPRTARGSRKRTAGTTGTGAAARRASR